MLHKLETDTPIKSGSRTIEPYLHNKEQLKVEFSPECELPEDLKNNLLNAFMKVRDHLVNKNPNLDYVFVINAVSKD